MTGIAVTTLDNGLRVASDPMGHLATVSLGVWIGTGTRDEPAKLNGIAHLLGHMAFKGTEREIAEEIEAVGGHINAHTSRESTAYYAKVMAEHVPLAVDILADILLHSRFDAGELARERDVVLQEIGLAHDTPDDLIFDRFQETAYADQLMGRPVTDLARRIPMGRLGDAWDVAYAALYPASDESKYATGSELVIDGGPISGCA